ncbi:hypothetical protein NXZ19_25920, partial [Escherichia coli]|nr:hypothetical protein [Escherichia coli]
ILITVFLLRTTVLAGEVIIQENNRMLKRRDAFLKKSALAVSVALLLSAQAQAVLTGPVDANSSSLLIGENSFITNSTGTANNTFWICPYISRHLLSLNPLLACCRRYSRGER